MKEKSGRQFFVPLIADAGLNFKLKFKLSKYFFNYLFVYLHMYFILVGYNGVTP